MNSNSKCNTGRDERIWVVNRLRQTFHLQPRGVCHAILAPDFGRTIDDSPDADPRLVHPVHSSPTRAGAEYHKPGTAAEL
jgi:hypothetical protein